MKFQKHSHNLFPAIPAQILAILLVFTLFTSNLLTVFAFTEDNIPPRDSANAPFTIDADSTAPITITKPEVSEGPDDPGDIFELDSHLLYFSYSFSIQKDSGQHVSIAIKNDSYAGKEFYLTCENTPSDLDVHFTGGGSKEEPSLLSSGGALNTTLEISAQNAKKSYYRFQLNAYTMENGVPNLDSSAKILISISEHSAAEIPTNHVQIDSRNAEIQALTVDNLNDGQIAFRAELTQARDVSLVEFFLDGKKCEQPVQRSRLQTSEEDVLYWITLPSLALGTHQVEIRATDTEGNVIQKSISHEEILRTCTLHAVKPLKDPSFTINVKSSSGDQSNYTAQLSQSENGDWQMPLTPDMLKNSDRYKLIIVDNGTLMTTKVSPGIVRLTDPATTGRTLSFDDREEITIQDILVSSFRDLQGQSLSLVEYFPPDFPLLLPAGFYHIQVNFFYLGESYNVIFDEIDLTKSDVTLDLFDTLYTYPVRLEASHEGIQFDSEASLIYKTEDGRTRRVTLDVLPTGKGHVFSCAVSASQLREDMKESTLAVSANNKIFYLPNPSRTKENILTLNDTYGTVKFDMPKGTQVKSVSVRDNFRNEFKLYPVGQSILMPEGTYFLEMSYSFQQKIYFKKGRIELSAGELETIDLSDGISDAYKVSLDWADPSFEKVDLSISRGFTPDIPPINEGESLALPNGTYEMNVHLYYDTYNYSLDCPFSVKDADQTLSIGNHFTGTLAYDETSIASGDFLRLSLYDLEDEYGNNSWHLNSENPFYGTVTFTNAKDSSEQIHVKTTFYRTSCSVMIPDVEGDFYVSFSSDGERALNPIWQISVSPEKATLRVGDTLDLRVRTFPEEAEPSAILWESSTPNVVTVDSTGRITARSVGKAVITATAVNGGVTASCNVTVTKKPSSGSGGSGGSGNRPSAGQGQAILTANPLGNGNNTILPTGNVHYFTLTTNLAEAPTAVSSNPSIAKVVYYDKIAGGYRYQITGLAPGTASISFMAGATTLPEKFAVTVTGQVASVRSDTTMPFSVKHGSAYCFKMTVLNGSTAAPSFTVGNGSAFKTQFVAKKGDDYYYRIWSVGAPGLSTGVYTTMPGQTPQLHSVVTVG